METLTFNFDAVPAVVHERMGSVLVPKDCGLHHGSQPGPCAKCVYLRDYRDRNRHALQYTGTPWFAVIGKPIK